MSIIAVRNAWSVSDLNVGQKLVLLALADCHNGKTGKCFPSIETLAGMTGYSTRQVKRHVATLKRNGIIQVNRVRRTRQWAVNFYTFAWDDQGTYSNDQGTFLAPSGDTRVPLTGIEPEVGTGTRNPTGARQACPGGVPESQEAKNRENELLQKFPVKRCLADHNSRLRFYMDCGRLHTTAGYFHTPKNPGKPISFGQGNALRGWFSDLPTTGCEVMNFTMKNWRELRKKWMRNNDPQFDRLARVPTISALEKFGSKPAYELWKKSASDEALLRVAEKVKVIEDDYGEWRAYE